MPIDFELDAFCDYLARWPPGRMRLPVLLPMLARLSARSMARQMLLQR